MIGGVEALRAELQVGSLGDMEVLHQREVYIAGAGSARGVSACVAELTRVRDGIQAHKWRPAQP
jgi:hypothetical protein